MTIDKAIEILNDGQYHLALTLNPDFYTATKLGNEALKRLKENRHPRKYRKWGLLPGETKE